MQPEGQLQSKSDVTVNSAHDKNLVDLLQQFWTHHSNFQFWIFLPLSTHIFFQCIFQQTVSTHILVCIHREEIIRPDKMSLSTAIGL